MTRISRTFRSGLTVGCLTVCAALNCAPQSGDIFEGIEDEIANAEPIDTFDGEWLGVEFAYAIEIENRIGTVTQSNTPAYFVSEPILVIREVTGGRFSGRHLFTNGSVVNVIGSLTDNNTITMAGGGVNWTLTRFQLNLEPTADDQTVAVPFDTPTAITLSGNDPDNSPEALSFDIENLPSRGTLTGTPPNVTYTPDAGFAGNDRFSFSVSDGQDRSANADILISVAQGNQPPSVDAGDNDSITFPTDFVALNGTVNDDGLPDGTLTTMWTVISGLADAVEFVDPTAIDTTASFALEGIYVLQLEATDGELTASATVTIFVRDN